MSVNHTKVAQPTIVIIYIDFYYHSPPLKSQRGHCSLKVIKKKQIFAAMYIFIQALLTLHGII